MRYAVSPLPVFLKPWFASAPIPPVLAPITPSPAPATPRPTQHLVKLVYVVCSDSDGSFQRPPKEETEDLASLTDSRSLRLAQSTFGSVEEGVRKLRVAGQVNIEMEMMMQLLCRGDSE